MAYKRLFESIKIKNLIEKFKKDKFEVDEDDENSFSVTNKKGFTIYFTVKNNKIYALVQGYKRDISLDEVSSNYNDLKYLVNSINIKWMKEYDPEGNRW
jgi:hypothetical protein